MIVVRGKGGGKVGLVPEWLNDHNINAQLAYIRCDQKVLDSNYLYYVLSSDVYNKALKNLCTGSAQPQLPIHSLVQLEISDIPSLSQQRIIASLLKLLDDKIQINNEINENLLQQAQSIYREMFVNTINPGRIVCRADECFDIGIGKTPPRKEQQWFSSKAYDVTWVSISDMGNCGTYISHSSEQLTKEAIERFNIRMIPDNTVILSFKLTVGRIAITHGEMTTNEAIAHFCSDKSNLTEYLYCYLRNYNFKAMGSTSSIATAVNSKIIKAMPFIVPTDEELQQFYSMVNPMFTDIRKNQYENKMLTDLRDCMLPKLLSGDIDVSQIVT